MFCKVFHVFLCMVAPQNVFFEGGGVRTLFRTKGAIRIFVVLGQCSLWLHSDDKICSGFALAASCPLNCDYFFFPSLTADLFLNWSFQKLSCSALDTTVRFVLDQGVSILIIRNEK